MHEVDIESLLPDEHNANLGTVRGQQLLERSVKQYGAGRSILIDKAGRVIAGNKTLEAARAAGIRRVIVVDSDGRQLVAVLRKDVAIGDKTGRALAVVDNRVGELNLQWDPQALEDLRQEVGDLRGVGFTDEELASMRPGAEVRQNAINEESGATVRVAFGDDLTAQVPREAFKAFLEDVYAKVGHSTDEVVAELSRRLGL